MSSSLRAALQTDLKTLLGFVAVIPFPSHTQLVTFRAQQIIDMLSVSNNQSSILDRKTFEPVVWKTAMLSPRYAMDRHGDTLKHV